MPCLALEKVSRLLAHHFGGAGLLFDDFSVLLPLGSEVVSSLALPSGLVVKYKPVDPAGSHMLVSKIKPCMSQYKLLYGETANGSLKQL